jgi:hypothetical protein
VAEKSAKVGSYSGNSSAFEAFIDFMLRFPFSFQVQFMETIIGEMILKLFSYSSRLSGL